MTHFQLLATNFSGSNRSRSCGAQVQANCAQKLGEAAKLLELLLLTFWQTVTLSTQSMQMHALPLHCPYKVQQAHVCFSLQQVNAIAARDVPHGGCKCRINAEHFFQHSRICVQGVNGREQ